MLKFLYRQRGPDLGRKLKRLSTEGHQIATAAVRSEVRDLILEGFEREVEPRGRPWPRRKPPTGTWPLLQKSGKMIRSFDVQAGWSIRVRNRATSKQGRNYAIFHQFGTRKMPARRVAPAAKMPPHWRKRIDLSVKRSLERLS